MDVGALVCTLFASIALRGACPVESPTLDPTTAPIPRGLVVERVVPGDPELAYYVHVPRSVRPGAAIFVTVHGVSRNARSQADAFARLAAQHGAILVAPRFRGRQFRDYQRLGRAWKGSRADLALERLIDHVGRLTGAATDSVLLFGYSGGAQFVHRYAMAHPERVVAAAVSSPGWFTFPDAGRWYPYGIRRTPELPGVAFEPEAFLEVPMLVTVGAEDVARSRSLRRSHHVDRQQGRTRVERAERWVDAMARAAHARALPTAVDLVVLDGMHHSFGENVELGGLAEIVVSYLFAPQRLARLGARPSAAGLAPSDAVAALGLGTRSAFGNPAFEATQP